MKPTVLIAGGGTGGHIFPGLAVAETLIDRGVAIHWLGAERGLERKLLADRDLDLTLLSIEGIRERSLSATFRALSHLPKAVTTAVDLVLTLKPAAVLGVGGYASVSGISAAGLLGTPWIIQEQNAVPGLTNQSLAPWADLVCCGFKDALEHFPSMPVLWTGNPVRPEFQQIPDQTPSSRPRLLILGGSQGSLFLNRTVPRALALLRDQDIQPAIRHQSGARWLEVVKTAYADLGIEATIETFLSRPWEALEWADLVIARAGALTVTELAAAGRASLLVPFAAAAGNHQECNARALERSGGTEVLLERQADFDQVAETLARLFSHPDRLATMGRAARTVSRPGSAEIIADALMGIGGIG